MNNNSYSAIILSAGLSSRMGELKALLNWQGKKLIQYQIEQMQEAGVNHVCVVLGYEATKIEKFISSYQIKITYNDQYETGKSSSIRHGVTFIDDDTKGIFVTAVDQPVPATILKQQMNELESTKAPIVIPSYNGKGGHPVLFSGSIKHELFHVKEKTQGMRNIIQKYRKQISYLAVNDSSVLYNFNKPEDYHKYSL